MLYLKNKHKNLEDEKSRNFVGYVVSRQLCLNFRGFFGEYDKYKAIEKIALFYIGCMQ